MKKGSVDARAGRLLARTRLHANLTQAQVAARAGLPQSTVSAYESGGRQPTLPMLSKLLEAMGSELVTAATPLPEHLAALSGPVGLRLRRHRHLIVEAAARYGVERVRVLGSATRGEDRPGDRVELRLDQTPAATLGGHPNLTAELEEITGLSVKITTAQELSRKTRSETDDPGVTL